jgi:hypothetical protein
METDSRAVTMTIPFGADSECTSCERLITFIPPGKGKWVVANVYEGKGKKRRWNRVENWHPECYEVRGLPYGEAVARKTTITKRTSW